MTKDELRELVRQHLHDDGSAIETLWPEIVGFVADWLDAHVSVYDDNPSLDLAEFWREEMS